MVITKEMICNKLITNEKYSSSSINKLMKNKKNELTNMYQELFGNIKYINLSDESRKSVLEHEERKSKGFEVVFEHIRNNSLFS